MRVMRWYKLVELTVLIILLLGNANAATLNVNASGGADSIKAQDAINNATASNTPMIAGGPCSYDKFRGTGRIISIHQTVQSKQQAVYSGYEGFEIKFKFMPVEPVNIENVRWVNNIQDILDREYLLLLTNSWYPGQNYLEKYNITENATFGGELLLITKGTCSPTIFRFDTINTTDYFETTAYNPTPTVTASSIPTITTTETPMFTSTSNLEQEVKDLKDRLNKTEENQTQQESRISWLESTVNSFLNWFKSIF